MEKGAIEQMVIGGIDLLVISSFALWHILAIGSHIKMHGFSYQAIGSHVKMHGWRSPFSAAREQMCQVSKEGTP